MRICGCRNLSLYCGSGFQIAMPSSGKWLIFGVFFSFFCISKFKASLPFNCLHGPGIWSSHINQKIRLEICFLSIYRPLFCVFFLQLHNITPLHLTVTWVLWHHHIFQSEVSSLYYCCFAGECRDDMSFSETHYDKRKVGELGNAKKSYYSSCGGRKAATGWSMKADQVPLDLPPSPNNTSAKELSGGEC